MSTPRRHDTENGETVRKPIESQGQYTVNKIKKLEGMVPQFKTYDLIIRGHTGIIVGDVDGERTLETLSVQFNGPVAYRDLGSDLLRATRIVLPLEGIKFLETVTNRQYVDSRRVENPLTYNMFDDAITHAFNNLELTIPSNPGIITDDSLD